MIWKARPYFLILGDILFLYGSLFLALFFRYGGEVSTEFASHFFPFTLIFPAWLTVFYIFDLYSPKAGKNRLELASIWVGAILVNFLISIAAFYVFNKFFQITPRANLILFTAVFALSGFFWRASFLLFLKSAKWKIKFVILGDSKNLSELLSYVGGNPGLGYKSELWEKRLDEESIVLAENKIASEDIKMLVIHPEAMKSGAVAALSYGLLPRGVEIVDFVDFYEELYRKMPLEDLGQDWFVREIKSGKKLYNIAKRIFDFILSSAFLVIFSPLFLIIAVLVKITSRGPSIYRQERVGRNNRNFMLYKFRTMREDAERGGVRWAEARDPRATPFGRILRSSHLDEMPQLWNILRGDLSFVGPRPERPEFVSTLREEIPHYDMRHIIKPGLTGWAQINYRYGSSALDASEKLKYELYYMKNRSFILDLLIILKTARMVFKNH